MVTSRPPVSVPAPVDLGRDTRRRAEARQALAEVIWGKHGRRLPTERALVAAIEACDPRDVWWVCEACSAGPVYLLPTKGWVTRLAAYVTELGARSVLEVGAGDGFLAACLAAALPDVTVRATDSGAWRRPAARMGDEDRARYGDVPFAGIALPAGVERLGAVAAVERYRPDLVIASWPPPGPMVERVIRAPSSLVLEVGAEGDVTGDARRTWRYEKDFVEGPLQDTALCRLDARPRGPRATRLTLYYGRAHPRHGLAE